MQQGLLISCRRKYYGQDNLREMLGDTGFLEKSEWNDQRITLRRDQLFDLVDQFVLNDIVHELGCGMHIHFIEQARSVGVDGRKAERK